MCDKTKLVLTSLIVAFAPLIQGGTTHLPVFILRLLVIALLAVFLADGLESGVISLFRTPLDYAVIAFMLAALAGAFIAPYKEMALTWVQLTLHYALFFYMARAALELPGGRECALIVILGMGWFEAGAVISQWVSGAGRPSGTFFNPNMVAGYVVPSMLIALSLVISGHKAARGVLRSFLLVLLAASCAAAIVLTGSRGGAISLIVGLSVVVWFYSRRWAVAGALVLAAVLFVFPNPVRDRIFSKEPFAYSRALIWKSDVRMMADHPLGVGLGNFKSAWTRYNFPVEGAVIRYGKTASEAHSEYLHIGAETGFIGLAAFVFGVSLLLRALYRFVRLPGREEDRPLAVGILGGTASVFTQAAVDSNLHEPGIVFLLILLVVLAFRMYGVEGDKRTVLIEKGGRTRLALSAAVLLLLMAVWAVLPALGYYYSGRCLDAMKKGDPGKALAFAEKASAVEPGNASYHDQAAAARYGLYTMYRRAEDLRASLMELGEAGRLNPLDRAYPAREASVEYAYAAGLPDPVERMAWLDLALKSSRRARELDPYSWDILLTQARIEAARGDTQGAVATLRTLTGLEPNFLMGRLLLARALKESGKTKEALDECYDILKISERLAGERLDESDGRFVAVDMDAVKGLVRSLEAGSR